MERIVTLVNEKNHYLEKFYSMNEAEIVRVTAGDFSNIERFYKNRDKIIEMITYIDQQTDIEVTKSRYQQVPDTVRTKIQRALQLKDQYAKRILDQDLRLLSLVEAAKSSILKELQSVRFNKKAVGSYKSPDFDSRLDEKL